MNWMQKWLSRNNLTQHEAARLAGISLRTVSSLANGGKMRRVVKYALLWIEHTRKT
jgi:predicted XRE-type DNA-binding protein